MSRVQLLAVWKDHLNERFSTCGPLLPHEGYSSVTLQMDGKQKLWKIRSIARKCFRWCLTFHEASQLVGRNFIFTRTCYIWCYCIIVRREQY